MTPTLPGLLAIILYLLASTLLTLRLMRGVPDVGCHRNQVMMIGLGAVIIHGLTLYPAILTDEGLNLGIFYAASLVAMTTSLLLVLASFIEPVENLGIPVFPTAAVCIGLTLLYPTPHIVSDASAWQLNSHILASLLAYSLLLYYYRPFPLFTPHAHMGHGDGANVHILGMWFNFLFSAGLITYFVVRMASMLRQQEARAVAQREDRLRWIPDLDTPAYPMPMVDHKAEREVSLAAYQRGKDAR